MYVCVCLLMCFNCADTSAARCATRDVQEYFRVKTVFVNSFAAVKHSADFKTAKMSVTLEISVHEYSF